jgi:hypothetical protein
MKSTNRVTLSTQSFTKEEVQLLVFWGPQFFCGTQKNYALLTQSVARVFIPPTEESKLDRRGVDKRIVL